MSSVHCTTVTFPAPHHTPCTQDVRWGRLGEAWDLPVYFFATSGESMTSKSADTKKLTQKTGRNLREYREVHQKDLLWPTSFSKDNYLFLTK